MEQGITVAPRESILVRKTNRDKYNIQGTFMVSILPLGESQSKRARLEIDRLPTLNVQVVGRFERPFQREDFPPGCPGAGDIAAHLLAS